MRSMGWISGLLVILSLSGAHSVQAQVYKFTDENGVTHYTSVRPESLANVAVLNFPCYASDPKCSQLDWEHIPLNRRAFEEEIRAAAEVFEVDGALVRAIIHAESAYQPDALSPRGAQGLMQLMPTTQQELQVVDVFDPVDNITGGTRYLAALLDQFDQDVELATAAYNAGPNAVRKHGGVPPYAETREYVRRVKILYRRYRSGES
ncbi:MAG: lytic transglycosylase domain-containing protein [Xanthomonadales bacterium]|nr:lytic transglycosylase domain-containing protein [Xanthomonadales bacterium]